MTQRTQREHRSSARELRGFDLLTDTDLARLARGLVSTSYSDSAGSTHAFYHYPARFSPAVARAVIESFSEPGDWVLDPFMGGGTTIIEGLALGRNMLGVDLNSLAHFVTRVRTTPVTARDERSVRAWARRCADKLRRVRDVGGSYPPITNLPGTTKRFIADALRMSEHLQSRKRRDLARCVLLRLGQWALDCRDFRPPRRDRLASQLERFADDMLVGLGEFTGLCKGAGLSPSSIARSRRLLCRNAVGLDADSRFRTLSERPRLVLTSPPYPSVHVLYHRWQYRGRKETAAPYWIANLRDGHPESYYTGGSRTPKGRRDYFNMIASAFRSIRTFMASDGVVVQLVGFSDAATQLPQYLRAMEEAGFEECHGVLGNTSRLGRRVPNRKWYAKLQGNLDASSELLLVHRPV